MKQKPKYIGFDGLGTHWECEFIGDVSNAKIVRLEKLLLAELHNFDTSYSRFLDNSLVGALNRRHKLYNPPDEMLNMLTFAKKMHDLSDGVFNISVGGQLHAKGYGNPNLAQEVDADFWDKASFTKELVSIPRGSTIDFGGFGKGWLIDKLCKIISNQGINNYIINGGGDIYVHSDTPKLLYLEHPTDQSKTIGQTSVAKGALAVSSTIKRRWVQDDKSHHHIIDPSTGQSSDSEVVSSYVRAESALIADTLATILIVKPQLKQKLEKQFNARAILIKRSQLA